MRPTGGRRERHAGLLTVDIFSAQTHCVLSLSWTVDHPSPRLKSSCTLSFPLSPSFLPPRFPFFSQHLIRTWGSVGGASSSHCLQGPLPSFLESLCLGSRHRGLAFPALCTHLLATLMHTSKACNSTGCGRREQLHREGCSSLSKV
jgi:hypothetical protein